MLISTIAPFEINTISLGVIFSPFNVDNMRISIVSSLEIPEVYSSYGTNKLDAKQALEKLQSEFDQFKVDSDNKLAQINKTNAIALALKDVKAHDSDVLMKLIDVDKIELGEDGKPKLDEVVNSLRESKPFLFEQEQQANTPQISVGGNPSGTGQNTKDPFQAIIDSYK